MSSAGNNVPSNSNASDGQQQQQQQVVVQAPQVCDLCKIGID